MARMFMKSRAVFISNDQLYLMGQIMAKSSCTLSKTVQFLDNSNTQENADKSAEIQHAILIILNEIIKHPEIYEQFDHSSIGVIAEAMNGEFESLFNALKELEARLGVSNEIINEYWDVIQTIAEEKAEAVVENRKLLGVYREFSKSGHVIGENFIFDLAQCKVLSVAPVGESFIEDWGWDANLCSLVVQKGGNVRYFLCPGKFEDFDGLVV